MYFDPKKLSQSLKLDQLADDISELVDVNVRLAKLEFKQHLAETFARLLTLLVVTAMLFAVGLMLSLGLAQFLNNLTKSIFWGYFCVGAAHLLLLFLVLLMRKSLKNYLENIVLKVLKNPAPSASEGLMLPNKHEKSETGTTQ